MNDIVTSIDQYLEEQSKLDLLRFITCGSADDGKSTLIGRMLYEAQLIFEDQVAALRSESQHLGTQEGDIDFALLVDVDGSSEVATELILGVRNERIFGCPECGADLLLDDDFCPHCAEARE